jgi:cellulose synthase/poly-beta-1,6-N-acetylglucosamine synthase-like glycosyltransferase
MLKGKKIVAVMPAYNAARTLRQTYDEVMAQGVVDLVILVDDGSQDETVAIAQTLGRSPSGKSGLWCQSKDLLPSRPRSRRRYRDYDLSRLPIRPAVDSGDGVAGGQRTLPVRPCFAHSGWRRSARRHALVILGEPVPHVCGEPLARCETVGIPHWLPGIRTQSAREAAD